jgi:hypothetical protein
MRSRKPRNRTACASNDVQETSSFHDSGRSTTSLRPH